MNRVLIDTDILSYYFKGDEIVIGNFKNYLQEYDMIEISLVTYYEIVGGLLAKNALKQLNVLKFRMSFLGRMGTGIINNSQEF